MKRKLILTMIGTAIIFAVLLLFPNRGMADPLIPSQGEPPEPGISDDYCLSCHDSPGLQIELESGEALYIAIDSVTHNTSVHGREGIACVQCHTDITEYPHREITAKTRREYTLQMYTLCERCHHSNYEATLDSTHQQALDEGNPDAAVCTDCHGAHNINEPEPPRSNIPKMCERCHSTIYTQYKESVHGAALIGDGDPSVPTCIDCHGVHDITGPSFEESFHLFSPQICADCHADEKLMAEHDISTEVFDTYISDFHGTTVVLFEKTAPDQETNKPVCIDCHGVHDMREVDDPESKVMKENLLSTCQKCHPDATPNFPDSWLGHYQPSPKIHPLVFFVDMFYKIIIPVTIGGMVVFVAADATRRISQKLENRK